MKLSDGNGQTIDFEIPEQYEKIGINCSGGADSAILLFMVASYIKEQKRSNVKLNVMTCVNDMKNRWNVRYATNIINYTIDKLKWNQFDIHYAYYRDVQDKKYFHEIEHNLFADKRLDLIISGLTANPKVEAIVENIHGEMVDLAENRLDIRDSDDKPTWTVNYNDVSSKVKKVFYVPFRNVDKRFVAAMYKQYGVEDLIHLTRSCEALPPLCDADGDSMITNYDPDFEKKPCGECWWCLERKWAFGDF